MMDSCNDLKFESSISRAAAVIDASGEHSLQPKLQQTPSLATVNNFLVRDVKGRILCNNFLKDSVILG